MDKKGIIFGVVFVAWFILSLVLLIVFTKMDNTAATLIVAGQYFAVFGIAICAAKYTPKLLGFLFLVIGIGIIVLTVLYYGDDGFNFGIEWKTVAVYGSMGVFSLIGAIMILYGLNKNIKLKTNCDAAVSAECVEVKTRYYGTTHKNKYGNKRILTYKPVYVFEYNFESYTLESGTYTNIGVPRKGEIVTLYINSSKPTEFYDKSVIMSNVMLMILGTIFFCFGMYMFYIR